MPGSDIGQATNIDNIQVQTQAASPRDAADSSHKSLWRSTDGEWYETDEASVDTSLAEHLDGDVLDVDFTPTNYTPSTSPAEAADVDDLTAHLAGIDNFFTSLPKCALIEEQQADTTNAGTATSGSWFTRVLNYEGLDWGNIVALASNRFTPVAGQFLIIARVPGLRVDHHRSRLYNFTQTSEVKLGSNARSANTGDSTMADSWIVHIFTANGTDAYEIQQQVQTTFATEGQGSDDAITAGVEIYTQVLLVKVG